MIVLDTSALFYWLYAPDKLTDAATIAINQADEIIINSISFWELGLKAKKGHLNLPQPIEELVRTLRQVDRVKFKATDETVWLENLALPWRHKDPADRTIVATAQLLDCPLITSDREIRAFYPKAIWK